MPQFDMRGQHVTNQYNAGRDINFGSVQTTNDLVAELERLKEEFVAAKANGILSEETAVEAEDQITKAVVQAKKPDPNKKTLLGYLNMAKVLIEDVTTASGLVTALVSATEVVQKLFQ